MNLRRVSTVVVGLMLAAGCGDGGDPPAAQASPPADMAASTAAAASAPADAQRHPDVVAVEITPAGAATFDLAVTVSSPYDTPERYADGWRVLTPDGTTLGTHTLMHDHAGEQPFTRTQTGVEIPLDVREVTVEGRDQRHGFGGGTVTVDVPHGAG